MSLSDSENIVIREILKKPDINLEDIKKKMVAERKKEQSKYSGDKRFQKEVDVSSIAKFKSLGLKKLNKGLKELADILRLDYSIQGRTKEERENDKNEINILAKNGILLGYDFRDDRGVYIFYSPSEKRFLPWQDHLCRKECRDECQRILTLLREERDLAPLRKEDIRVQFKSTFTEIIEKNKD